MNRRQWAGGRSSQAHCPGARLRWALAVLGALCAAAKIAQISRFRSSSGHDDSDAAERGRSMKHYFIAPDAATAIAAPVAGTVSMLRADFVGTQVHITSDLYPDFSFIIFHVALARPLVLVERMAEGQVLAAHVGRQTWSDIAVSVNASDGWRLVSYFDTLSESAFAVFQARDVATGITGSVFVVAVLPAAMGGGIFLPSPTQGWVSFTGCAKAPVVLQGWRFRGFTATVAGTCASMMAAGTFAAVHTLQ